MALLPEFFSLFIVIRSTPLFSTQDARLRCQCPVCIQRRRTEFALVRSAALLLLMPLLLGPIASVLSAVLLPSIENASLKTRERFLVVVSDTMS